LSVNGTLGGGGAMNISPGATLIGTGIISKDLTINGAVRPGNSIGTLFLVGAHTFTNGSSLEIEFDPSTSDLVDITGTLAIQPGAILTLIPDQGSYASFTSYPIVQTTGGVTGTFTAIVNPLPLFQPAVVYTPLDVFLELTVLPFAVVVPKGNAGQVAKCLDALSATSCSNLSQVIDSLQMLTSEEALVNALLQMQPSAFTSLSVVQENAMLYLTDAIDQRMELDVDTCCPSVFVQNQKLTAWITALGAHTSQENQGQEPGYRANSPGLITGVDAQFGSMFKAGTALGYTHSHLHWRQNRGESNMQTFYWSLYGKWGLERAFIQTALLGGYNFYSVDRKIDFGQIAPIHETAQSFHHGLEGSAHLKGGYRWGCRGIAIAPFIRFDYLYVHEDAFKERGAQSLNLRVHAKNSDLLVSEAGVDFSHCFIAQSSTYTPYLQLSAIRESRFKGEKERASFECGCEMTVTGLYPSRTLGSVKGGLNAEISRHTVSLSYQGKFAHRYSDQSVDFSYVFKF
jgi:subtilase-type serine protease